MIKVGERLVVQGMIEFPAYVEKIESDNAGNTIIFLDWKEHGKSRVYLHDEGKVWVRYSEMN